MIKKDFEAIVVGSGPNGLAAAIKNYYTQSLAGNLLYKDRLLYCPDK